MDEIWTFAIKMINFGVAIFAGCYIFVTSLNYSAERQVREEGGGDLTTSRVSRASQVHKVRILYLRAALGQDMTWYDTQTTANFAAKMTE